MARIRSIKPEAFTSESLAQVSVEAERTFVGLLTQADDRGRHRDNAAVIAGALWPLRPDHPAACVEDDLQQLAQVEVICRYVGCDGKRYLHFPKWDDHQKINKPSESRLPVCRTHEPGAVCGHCKRGNCPSRHEFPEGSGRATGGFREGSRNDKTDTASSADDEAADEVDAPAPLRLVADHETGEPEETAGHSDGQEDSGSVPGALPDDSRPGSRNLDLGTNTSAPASRSRAHAPKPGSDDDPEWLKFWAAYPLKRGKKEARKAWATAIKVAPAEDIITGAERYAVEVKRRGTPQDKIKYAQGWLSGERWADEPAQQAVGDSTPQRIRPRDEWKYRQ